MIARASLLGIALLAFGCGDGDSATIDSGTGTTIDGGNGTTIDGGGVGADANLSQCGTTQCSDCTDNDNDGFIDGEDVECTGGADDDEGSFATGISGDNVDNFNQDCFFDGNSGSGNDGCSFHTCCMLGFTTAQQCNDYFDALGVNANPGFNPAECAVAPSATCIANCGPLTPPGCDCFGCCTICDPVTDVCGDILTNPTTAPECDQDSIGDPTKCPVCTKVEACSAPCDAADCILCPGQDPADLPAGCEMQACPAGTEVCDAETPCPSTDYCSNGCCIFNIP